MGGDVKGITSVVEGDFVIYTTSENDTLDTVFKFLNSDYAWKGMRQVMWDLAHFDFQSMDSKAIHSFVAKSKSMTEGRAGLKTAFLTSSENGFATMRMLEQIASEDFRMELNVFREKDAALKWLNQ